MANQENRAFGEAHAHFADANTASFDDSTAVGDQTTRVAHEVRDQTANLASQAGQQLNRAMTEGKNRAADGLQHLAGVLRDTARNLGQNDASGRMTTYTYRAATRIDAMSTYMRDADVSTMLGDAGRFARRRPEVLLAGTVLAGLLVARLLKARHAAPEPWTSAARWHETLQKGTKVVSAAADSVKQGAIARGLNPEALVIAGGRRLWRN